MQLKNLQFYATVRVIFKLSDQIPCISAVVVALLAQVAAEAGLIDPLILQSLCCHCILVVRSAPVELTVWTVQS